MAIRDDLIEQFTRLDKEAKTRYHRGGYSTDAPALWDIYDTLAKITLKLIHFERLLAKKNTRKK